MNPKDTPPQNPATEAEVELAASAAAQPSLSVEERLAELEAKHASVSDAYLRAKHVDQRINTAVLKQVGMSQQEVEEMYQVMAIADYEDRFVIPSTHREYAENTFNVRGGCGFSFGNGCSEGMSETSLFGSEKKRTIPIKAVL